MARLRRLYALTGAEARLAQVLLAGDRLDVLGDRFGVGKEPLRSQLKSLFLKTLTTSQIRTDQSWPAWLGRVPGMVRILSCSHLFGGCGCYGTASRVLRTEKYKVVAPNDEDTGETHSL